MLEAAQSILISAEPPMHSFSEGLFLHHATASFARSYALRPHAHWQNLTVAHSILAS
jgi:hypothetical protein